MKIVVVCIGSSVCEVRGFLPGLIPGIRAVSRPTGAFGKAGRSALRLTEPSQMDFLLLSAVMKVSLSTRS